MQLFYIHFDHYEYLPNDYKNFPFFSRLVRPKFFLMLWEKEFSMLYNHFELRHLMWKRFPNE